LLLQILEAFLRYDENGVIHPSSHGRDNANWLRTMYSIRVYALNRADLVSERRALIQRIDHRLALIARLAELRSELKRSRDARIAGAVAETIADMIAEEIDALLDMRRSDQPYAGLARQLIRRPMGRSPRNSDRERGP
jgi:hypothetical protein